MDEQRLQRIKERAKGVSKGPWRWREIGGFHEYVLLGPPNGTRGTFERVEDAEFVAHARQDIPALIEALEECWRREQDPALSLADDSFESEDLPADASENLDRYLYGDKSESSWGGLRINRPNYCPNCGAVLASENAAVGIHDDRSGDGGYDTACATCGWSGDIMPDDGQG